MSVIAVTLLVMLLVGAVTGRVKVTSCCSVDARCDARMRAAFEDDTGSDHSAGGASSSVDGDRLDQLVRGPVGVAGAVDHARREVVQG